MKREKEPRRIGFIAGMTLLVLLILVIGSAAFLLLVPPEGNRLTPGESGIGFTSLCGGESAWMDGGLKANLLAVAIGRGKEVDAAPYSEELAVLALQKDGAPAEVTMLRDPLTGEIAFLGEDGAARIHIRQYLLYLMDDENLSVVFNRSVPESITVGETQIFASDYDLLGTNLAGEPVRFSKTADDGAALPKIVTTDAVFPVAGLPEASRFRLQTAEGEEVFSGTKQDLDLFSPQSHTEYSVTVEAAQPDGSSAGYRFLLEYLLRPTFSVSSGSVPTGDTLVITVSGIIGEELPTVGLPFEFTPDFRREGNTASALIPFDHLFTPGDYQISVYCDGYEEAFGVSVTEVDYPRDTLTISGEGAAANNSESNQTYANTMYPLFESFDPEIYWEGLFIHPVDGTITTEYGIYRYVNGSETPTRHAAIDIAAAEGTPIAAPNRGKVLFSDFLELSGNTVLIEHGMGLHTLYMHLDERSVAAGAIVETGQVIGTVGTTGYSTGPHLHYQMMIGSRSISPWFAEDGTAGFYALKPVSE